MSCDAPNLSVSATNKRKKDLSQTRLPSLLRLHGLHLPPHLQNRLHPLFPTLIPILVIGEVRDENSSLLSSHSPSPSSSFSSSKSRAGNGNGKWFGGGEWDVVFLHLHLHSHRLWLVVVDGPENVELEMEPNEMNVEMEKTFCSLLLATTLRSWSCGDTVNRLHTIGRVFVILTPLRSIFHTTSSQLRIRASDKETGTT